jgi:hypothetical protein
LEYTHVSKSIGAQVFLKRFLPLVTTGNVVFEPRNGPKTRQFLLDNDLTVEDAFGIVLQLRAEECVEGPEGDRDGTAGSVMVFHHRWGSKVLYVKLKLWSDETGDAGLLMSMHEEGRA